MDLIGDNTTSFESIQIQLLNDVGTLLYDNWLVGTTLSSASQIELNGTYPISINIASGSGNFTVSILPTFSGTAPTVTNSVIRPFKIV
jgi:hypothetical protein